MTGRVFTGIRAVLFDLDGTLIDSAPDLGAAADLMRIGRGLPSLPLARYRPMAGAGARGMLRVAFDMAPEHKDYEAHKEEFFVHYEACLTQRTQAFAGVGELLDVLQGHGLLWGVVTNKSQRFTTPLTQAMPLFGTARTIISGDTTPHAKPHPEPLLEAARRLNLPPNVCLYVGDDERDIAAGRAAGMPTVAARYGYLGMDADVSSWGADAEVSYPLGVLKLLELP
ncbi:MAG: HAD-IA family hydrolase [Hydrogenophaga sp.]|jgi:phosphoglycolate phosphatase|uniref:HAD-IA family hydrolase n=1 Tax=Hydrogenophaga sp. TaxID=1904254 RepID=UPI0027283BFA|nr:HAD-IA family hydrolase [Hydrogenophaga sp.]MDO9201147.1 HAD-IA family hydrolase [Hydrogenophaga sp.]MDO9483695.1 HAD-IA family hydrolase [Hydrogenophaga sp.]MDO9572180.1 HAD-IA family hydrolase [Hydrogenophaga sp.]MDP1894309.1 HAD-IA family hydrolase [Hydrogenophaga sp.]MDP2093410.1 HAD-IA family hydrolase [Hydrogenophaga sp.]